jgi:hypothetical protein
MPRKKTAKKVVVAHAPQERQVGFWLKGVLMVIIATPIALFLAYLISHDLGLRDEAREWRRYIESNEQKFETAFVEAFTAAEKCQPVTAANCLEQNRRAMDEIFLDIQGEGVYGRPPMYFIRYKDEENIEKLFQDGRYFTEMVDTRDEQKVIQMLKGKRSPLRFPLYTCYGGDDFLCDVPVIGQFVPSPAYLKDTFGEAELILLLKNDQGEIIGAVVALHGD